MATRCCDHRISCPGAGNLDFDSPFANLSAEAPDIDFFIGINWGWDRNVPRLDSWWTRNSCLGVCESAISQAEADACAARNQLICMDGDWKPPPVNPVTDGVPFNGPRTPRRLDLFPNNPETCIASCPDGIGFAFTTPAGKYISPSQILSDRMALSEACRLAIFAKICLSSLSPSEVCTGKQYLAVIHATGGTAPMSFSVVAGTVPPGIILSQGPGDHDLTLAGIPTAGGAYQFTIRSEDAVGHFMQKTFTLSVAGIDQATLPDGQVGIAYADTLTASNLTLPFTWSISSGTLPAGLSLNSASGAIFGTPTATGDSTFTVQVTDGLAISCTRQYTLHVSAACFVDSAFANNDLFFPQVTLGVAAGVNSGTLVDFVWFNRTRFNQAQPTDADFPVANGAVFGSFFPVTNRLWYQPLGGPAVQLGPIGNSGLNHWPPSEAGLCGYLYTGGGGWNLAEVWSPISGVLVTLGAGPTGAGAPDFAMGPNGDLVWFDLNTGFAHIWSPISGDVSMGVNPGGVTRVGVAASGHAAMGGSGGGWHWNGVALVQRTANNTSRISINASDEIAGMLNTGAFVWRWTSGAGFVNLGLPPGAASAIDCWITDTGLIVVSANNGPWFYWNGAWGALINLLPAGSGITALNTVVWVDHAGYAHGGATVGVNHPNYIAKLCPPQ